MTTLVTEATVKLNRRSAREFRRCQRVLASKDFRQVHKIGAEIASRRLRIGETTFSQAGTNRMALALEYDNLRHLHDKFLPRIRLAGILASDNPTTINIGVVRGLTSDLKQAGKEFGAPVEQKLAGLGRTKFTFWADWQPEAKNIADANVEAAAICADETLPEGLRYSVWDQYAEVAAGTTAELKKKSAAGREVSAYDLEENLRDVWLPAREALALVVADPDDLKKFDDEILDRVCRADIMPTIRENPHGQVYRDGLLLLSDLLGEPESAARGFQQIGVTGEDMMALFAVSALDRQGAKFAKIAQAYDDYDEKSYQTIARKALRGVVTREPSAVAYNGGELALYPDMIRTPKKLIEVAQSLVFLRISLQDELVQRAVEAEIERMKAGSFTSQAEELRAAAIRFDILPS